MHRTCGRRFGWRGGTRLVAVDVSVNMFMRRRRSRMFGMCGDLGRSGLSLAFFQRRGWLQAVLAVPADGIVFERRDHLGQRLAQRALRLPIEQRAGARDVEGVVVVGPIDHPRLDELLPGEKAMRPGARLGDQPGDALRLRGLLVQQAHERVLQLVVAERVRFADQDRGLRRQLRAPRDGALDGVDHVVQVDEGLTVRGLAGVEMPGELPLVDALHLVRERRRVADVVVDTGEAQDHGGDAVALLPDQRLGADLRLGVGPGRPERPVLVDELSRLARFVHEHGAGENELVDFEPAIAQPAQQTSRALDRDRVVARARLAEEIVVGS